MLIKGDVVISIHTNHHYKFIAYVTKTMHGREFKRVKVHTFFPNKYLEFEFPIDWVKKKESTSEP